MIQFLDAAKNAGVDLPPEATQEKLHPQFRQEITNTTGSAVAKSCRSASAPTGRAAEPDPAQPPRWVSIRSMRQAPRSSRRSPLHTKQDAEEVATEAIRSKLLSMQLSQGLTRGEAAERDPTIRAKVDRAVSRVRALPVDYGPDQSVSVKMLLIPGNSGASFGWSLHAQFTRPYAG